MESSADTNTTDTGPLLPQQAKRYFPSRSRNQRRKTAVAIFLLSVGLIVFIMIVENVTLFRYPPRSPATAVSSERGNHNRSVICKKCNCTKELEKMKTMNAIESDDSLIKNWRSPIKDDSLLVKEKEWNSINKSDGSWIKMDTLIEEGIEQNDSRIIDYIQKNHLFPPLSETADVEKKDDVIDDGDGQNVTRILEKIFSNMTNGFFVEAETVLDGETTLALEKKYNWNGLLIEPSPAGVLSLKSQKRKAWIANVCVSPTVIPSKQDYLHRGNNTIVNKLRTSETDEKSDRKPHRAQCFPLFSILSAVGVTTVDYLSLAVQGCELQVLNTIPFGSVFIKVISMDFDLIPEGKVSVKAFMRTKGYSVAKLDENSVFVHKSLNYNGQIKAKTLVAIATTTAES